MCEGLVSHGCLLFAILPFGQDDNGGSKLKRGALAAQPPVLPSLHKNAAVVIPNGAKDHYPVKRSARHHSLHEGLIVIIHFVMDPAMKTFIFIGHMFGNKYRSITFGQ